MWQSRFSCSFPALPPAQFPQSCPDIHRELLECCTSTLHGDGSRVSKGRLPFLHPGQYSMDVLQKSELLGKLLQNKSKFLKKNIIWEIP